MAPSFEQQQCVNRRSSCRATQSEGRAVSTSAVAKTNLECMIHIDIFADWGSCRSHSHLHDAVKCIIPFSTSWHKHTYSTLQAQPQKSGKEGSTHNFVINISICEEFIMTHCSMVAMHSPDGAEFNVKNEPAAGQSV